MFRLLRTYFTRFIPLFIVSFVLTATRVVCELEVPNLMSNIVDIGIVNSDVGYVLQTGLVMLAWAAAAVVADVFNSLCAARAGMGFGRELRSALYARVSEFSLLETDEFGTSSLITRTTNDVQQLERIVQMGMTMALMAPIMLVGAAVMAWQKSAQLSLIVFGAIPVLVCLALIVMRFALPLLRSLQERIDKLNLVTREGLTGIQIVRAYCREPYEEQRFARANADLAQTNISVARRMTALMPLITIVLNIAIILIVWSGAQLVDVNQFQVGNLMALIQYAMHVLISTMMLSMILMLWPRAMAAAERIRAVLDTEPSVRDAQETVELADEQPGKAHTVRFDHVEFRFADASEPALDDISLTLEAGKTYALIGSTGSGKTTLVNLLLRFLEPSSGSIYLDGVDISMMRQEYLRSHISYAPQKTVLFSGSIADNIRYSNEDATDEEVIAAAKAAAAYDFIMAKEDGFDTRITQGGGGLSGGQKQRVSIARALAKRSGLYIFDDSFSALDFKTDAIVRKRLAKSTKGATVLIIAQRVAAAMDADEVIVLDRGRIDAIGTHEELLESSEVYREIVASQLTNEEVS